MFMSLMLGIAESRSLTLTVSSLPNGVVKALAMESLIALGV
jgi:hypothetical protein